MGMFSWQTSDTKKTLISHYVSEDEINRPTTRVATLLHPTNETLNLTGTYDGYGRLISEDGESYDIFALIMADNLQDYNESEELLRKEFFKDYEGNMKKIKLVENAKGLTYDSVPYSKDCPTQGFMSL